MRAKAITISQAMTAERDEIIRQTVTREKGRLFNFIKNRVSDEEDAEDILQDVFSQLVESYWDIASLDRVASWLFTVARNKITDLYRKKKPSPVSRQVRGAEEEESLGLLDIIPDLSSNPEDEMLRSLIWEQLEEALAELPEVQRQVFVMHEFEDMSFKEISEVTGEGVNTLLSRKRYAVLFMRERLRQLYEELIDSQE